MYLYLCVCLICVYIYAKYTHTSIYLWNMGQLLLCVLPEAVVMSEFVGSGCELRKVIEWSCWMDSFQCECDPR